MKIRGGSIARRRGPRRPTGVRASARSRSARRWRACAGLGLLALVLLVAPAAAQEGDRPAPAERAAVPADASTPWRAFVWMKGGPPVGPALFRALRALGIAGTNVAGTADAGAHAAAGVPFYVDHVAGKGPLYLPEAGWQRQLAGWLEERDDPAWLARVPCLDDPATLSAARARIDVVTEALGEARPAALALDDEISLSRRNNPFDFCRDAHTLAAHRAFLRARHADVAALNAAWETDFESFDEVVPFTTDAIREREFARRPQHGNFAPWADFRAFMDRRFAEHVGALARHARARVPGVPVGFTGGEAPSPFSGLDWWLMLREVDFVEPYDVAGSRELVRSFAAPDTLVLRTIFPDPADPRRNVHELWDYFLRGDDGAILWSADALFDQGRADRPSAWALAIAPTLRELSGPAAAEWMAAEPVPPRIALLESAASNRLHWLFDSRRDGDGWWRRSGSYEARRGSQNRTRECWQKVLEDLQHDYVHVDARALDDALLAPFDVLILPRAIALSDEQAAVIRRFGARGCVIADAQLGLFDASLRARERGVLDADFGIRSRPMVLETDVDGAAASESSAARPRVAEPGLVAATGAGVIAQDRIGETPILIERQTEGGGRFVYLNAWVFDYLSDRRSTSSPWLAERLRGLFRRAGVAPIAKLRGGDALPVRLFQRRRGAVEYLAVLPNWRVSTAAAEPPAGTPETAPETIELVLDRPRTVRDLRAPGENADGGRKRVLSIVLSAFEPHIFRIE